MNATFTSESIPGAAAFLKFLNNPEGTDSVFEISEALRHTKALELAVEYLKSIPEVNQIIRERYLGDTPDLDTLLEYPKDSLGYAYASNLKASNLDPKFYPELEVEDDASYILLRLRSTHDIWHVVTGFDTTITGELALQAFSLAQCHLPLAALLIAGGLIQAINYPAGLTNVMHGVSTGWNLGLNTKHFLAQKWEEHWDKPLTEWQCELGVKPV